MKSQTIKQRRLTRFSLRFDEKVDNEPIHRRSANFPSTMTSPSHDRNCCYAEATVASEPADGTKEIEKALVIPEKASSFRIHPDKICQDQCFYCGGRFGLFDTPCHVAQIKSLERQKKILDSK